MKINTTNFQTTISSSIGYQRYADFAISMEASWIEVFGLNCIQNSTVNWKNPKSCEKSPYNTTNYFNETDIETWEVYNDEIFDGYVVSGNIYLQQICLNASYNDPYQDYFCSIDP
jgi:hypothetical protein